MLGPAFLVKGMGRPVCTETVRRTHGIASVSLPWRAAGPTGCHEDTKQMLLLAGNRHKKSPFSHRCLQVKGDSTQIFKSNMHQTTVLTFQKGALSP